MMHSPMASTTVHHATTRTASQLHGSCLCGAVKWKLNDVYIPQICVCHCGACRQFSGSTQIPFAAIERSRMWPILEPFVDSNTLRSYRSSSAATRYFCGACSSPVVFDYHEEPHTLWIPLGSLMEDISKGIGLDPSCIDPSRDSHIFVNDQAGYATGLMSTMRDRSIPRGVNFTINKHDPCQPKDWDDIPTMEKNIQFVDEEGNPLV